MATRRFCVVITHGGKLFVGAKREEIDPLIEGELVKKVIWKDKPYGLDNFLKANPNEKESVYKALHYWALCAIGRIEYKEGAYGIIKRKLHAFGGDLYRRVKNYAKSIAAEFKKTFPPKWKQRKAEEKFLRFARAHY